MFSSPLRHSFYPSHPFPDQSCHSDPAGPLLAPTPILDHHHHSQQSIRSPLSIRSANDQHPNLPSPPISPPNISTYLLKRPQPSLTSASASTSTSTPTSTSSSTSTNAPTSLPQTRYARLTLAHKLQTLQTQRRAALQGRRSEDRASSRRRARGGDDAMQRQIVLAEQSRWEEGQAWMAAEVVNGDLEAEIEGLMHDGGELAGGQGWDGEVDVDEVMGEEMGGYEAFEPLFGSAEAAGMEGMGDQGPAGYVQDMEMISSADPVDHFLDIDMDDFDFDCGFASNAISSNQSLDYTGLRHQA